MKLLKVKSNSNMKTVKRLIPKHMADNDVLYIMDDRNRDFTSMYHDAEDIPVGFITIKSLVKRIEFTASRTTIPANQYEEPLTAISRARSLENCLAPGDGDRLVNHLKDKYRIGSNESELWGLVNDDLDRLWVTDRHLFGCYNDDPMY